MLTKKTLYPHDIAAEVKELLNTSYNCKIDHITGTPYIVGFHLNANFFSYINKIFNGEYNLEFDSFFAYITNLIKDNVKNVIPIFLEIIIIAIICGILQKLNSQIFSSGVNELILFVGLLGVILLLSGQVISIWKKENYG